MSAVPVSAPIDLEVAVRPRGGVMTAPRAIPQAPVALPRRRSKQVRASNLVATVLLNTTVFLSIAGGSFMASGFVGNVQLESANREALRSRDRAAAAMTAESSLRLAVDRLSSDDAVARWAKFHGFVPPYKLDAGAKAVKKE